MRKIIYGLTVLGVSLAVTLLANDRRPPSEGGSVGEATRQLLAEHALILRVLEVVRNEGDHIRRGFPMDENRVRKIVDFSRNFIDRCHYAKEEKYYFPALKVYAGQRVYGVIDELTAEHAYGRSIMDEIDFLFSHRDGETPRLIGERLSTYAGMLDRHIRTENERLYQTAGALLPNREERALLVGFDRVENVDLGPGFHEQYHNLGEELTDSLPGIR
jgi:hemerythrin-like domain-containing protein